MEEQGLYVELTEDARTQAGADTASIRSSARARCAGRCSATSKARSACSFCAASSSAAIWWRSSSTTDGEIDFRLVERAPDALRQVKKNAEEHAE